MSNPEFLAGQTVPAGKLQDLGEYSTFVPTLTGSSTNPALGSGGSFSADVHANGRLITVIYTLKFGTGGGGGSGFYLFPTPTNIFSASFSWAWGTVLMRDASVPIPRVGIVRNYDVNHMLITCASDDANVNNTTPWTWTVDDEIMGSFTYLSV